MVLVEWPRAISEVVLSRQDPEAWKVGNCVKACSKASTRLMSVEH